MRINRQMLGFFMESFFILALFFPLVLLQHYLCRLFHRKSWIDTQYENEMEEFL
jgi:hypothetical protein